MNTENSGPVKNGDVTENPPRNFPLADLISVETVVNLLVRKGICTSDELLEEEEALKQRNSSPLFDLSQIKIEGHHRHHHHSWLQKQMAKYRWSRRLGTTLFGWRWKKVKRVERDNPLTDV